jgi:hypothetical protein
MNGSWGYHSRHDDKLVKNYKLRKEVKKSPYRNSNKKIAGMGIKGAWFYTLLVEKMELTI